MNITHLRQDRDLRAGVERVLEDVVRQNVPSLSAANTASSPFSGHQNVLGQDRLSAEQHLPPDGAVGGAVREADIRVYGSDLGSIEPHHSVQ